MLANSDILNEFFSNLIFMKKRDKIFIIEINN